MNTAAKEQSLPVLISAEQIQKRVREMARQISDDYQGKTIHALALLENGFIFMADLVRALEVPVICQFIKPRYADMSGKNRPASWRFFSATMATSAGTHV